MRPVSWLVAELAVASHACKVSQPAFSLEASAFYTNLKNRRQVLFVNAPGGGFQELVNLVATESYGIEAVFDYVDA